MKPLITIFTILICLTNISLSQNHDLSKGTTIIRSFKEDFIIYRAFAEYRPTPAWTIQA